MTCDYCGKSLTVADKPKHAPHGLPLFVCSKCYEQLKESKVVATDEKINLGVPKQAVCEINNGATAL